MAIPWTHWNAPPLALNRPPDTLLPHATTTTGLRHARALYEVVKEYVESASNWEDRFPEPVELDAIAQYAQRPDLLEVILGVLAERLTRPYPYNIKALDILEHLLLQPFLSTPSSHDPLTPLLPHLSYLFYNPPNDPPGTSSFVKSKADSCLIRMGHEMDIRGMVLRVDNLGYDLNGGLSGGWGGWRWGRGEANGQGEGNSMGLGQGQGQGWAGKKAERPSGWHSTPLPGPMGRQWLASKDTRPVQSSAWSPHPPAGETSPESFTISTTTVTPGEPTLEHFKMHERTHAEKLVEEAERRRGYGGEKKQWGWG